jgi:hypothetical protein
MRLPRPSAAVLAAAFCAASLAGGAAPARVWAEPPGEDVNEPLKTALAQAAAAKTAKDDTALAKAISAIPPALKKANDPALKNTALAEMGKALKGGEKMNGSRRAALESLQEFEDGKLAWKEISGVYPADDAGDPTSDPDHWAVEVVKAVGALHPDGAIDKLLETFQKAKVVELSAAAVTSLGNYHASKQRERILEEMVKAAKLMVPARTPTKNASQDLMARWAVLEPAVAKALDALTGQTVGSATQWFTKVDEAKKNVKSLFKD